MLIQSQAIFIDVITNMQLWMWLKHTDFSLLGTYQTRGLFDHMRILISVLWVLLIPFSIIATSIYINTNRRQEIFFSKSLPTAVFLFFPNHLLTDMRYLIIILICISLVVINIKHLFFIQENINYKELRKETTVSY